MYNVFYIIICSIIYQKMKKKAFAVEKESICCKTNFLFSFNISVSSYIKTNTVIGNYS